MHLPASLSFKGIVHRHPGLLAGLWVNSTFSTFDPAALWRRFMPMQQQLEHKIAGVLYALQKYDEQLDFATFDADTPVQMWAAAELRPDVSSQAEGLEILKLKGGNYLVFVYTGLPEDFAPIARFIYMEWLTAHRYVVDNSRHHFALMGEKYRPQHPDSEEEIWIPVYSLSID